MKVKTGFKNMDIFERAAGFLSLRLDRGILVSLLPWLCSSWLASEPIGPRRRARPGAGLAESTVHSTGSRAIAALVAPIALYPDSLVAQILAASTFPEQVVEPTNGCTRILI